jgi:hypothetical protein
MGPSSWRDWFRLRCGAIAETIQRPGEITVVLCTRWRWHRGTCTSPRCSTIADRIQAAHALHVAEYDR